MAGFSVDYGPTKWVFANGYTIPNPCLRWDENADLDLYVRELVGDDLESTTAMVPQPRREKGRRASFGLEMHHVVSSAGTPATTDAARQRQIKENLAELAETAAASLATNGTQDVTVTPWTGATPITVSMVVLPPILGDRIGGVGYKVGLVVVLPDGGVQL